MAEERIVLQDIIYDDGDFKIKKHASLTPKEAIEKMARAAYYNASTAPANFPDWDKIEDEIGKEVKQGFIRFAEAALNALLEGK